MLEKLNRANCLFDIYGSLLTSRQQEALQLYFSDDLTLSEIAVRFGTSRQAVHDLIRRAMAALNRLENRLRIYAQFKYVQQSLEKADRILKEAPLGETEQRDLLNIINDLRRYNEGSG